MEKVNLIKARKEYYSASQNPVLVTLKPVRYLSIEGKGAPEKEFRAAIPSVYALAYGIKFACKQEGKDFVVPKMEALWWAEAEVPFAEVPREEWHWKILIPLPDFVLRVHFDTAKRKTEKKASTPGIENVRFETIHEGKSVQILHVGSYEQEEDSLQKIASFMKERNLYFNGQHHEIYISDPFKTPVERLKTILRYPVKEGVTLKQDANFIFLCLSSAFLFHG